MSASSRCDSGDNDWMTPRWVACQVAEAIQNINESRNDASRKYHVSMNTYKTAYFYGISMKVYC
jgi:hypothetical protein